MQRKLQERLQARLLKASSVTSLNQNGNSHRLPATDADASMTRPSTGASPRQTSWASNPALPIFSSVAFCTCTVAHSLMAECAGALPYWFTSQRKEHSSEGTLQLRTMRITCSESHASQVHESSKNHRTALNLKHYRMECSHGRERSTTCIPTQWNSH